MNKIRKFWKDNGTPFFFHVKMPNGDYFHLNESTCRKYDTVVIQDDGCTAMDCLVDLMCIYSSLDKCQDDLVISHVSQSLLDVLNILNYIVSIHLKSKNYDKVQVPPR